MSGVDCLPDYGQVARERQADGDVPQPVGGRIDGIRPDVLLVRPYDQDIEAQLRWVYVHATEPASAKDKVPTDMSWSVRRDADRVVLTLSMREHKTKSVFDMTKGGNLVSYDRDGPKQSESIRVKYEQRGGAWVPCDLRGHERRSRRRRGDERARCGGSPLPGRWSTNRSRTRTSTWPGLACRRGITVDDLRAVQGDRFHLRPALQQAQGGCDDCLLGRPQTQRGPRPGIASAWRTMVSSGGFVELLGLARPLRQTTLGDGVVVPRWHGR